MKKDQKGDLVGQLLFEIYKDKDLRSCKSFKEEIMKHYGYKVSYDLYAKIINYQVEKYGSALNNTKDENYIKFFNQKKHKVRQYQRDRMRKLYYSNKVVERVENEKSKRIIEN